MLMAKETIEGHHPIDFNWVDLEHVRHDLHGEIADVIVLLLQGLQNRDQG